MAAFAVVPDIPSGPEPKCEKIRFEWSDVFNLKKKIIILGHIIFLTTFSFKGRS